MKASSSDRDRGRHRDSGEGRRGSHRQRDSDGREHSRDRAPHRSSGGGGERSSSGRDGRPGSAHAGPGSQTTPPKPAPGSRPPGGGPGRGPGLGGLFASSSALIEAAKRRAQEAAASAAQDGGGGGEGARKRHKHEPIVWRSPSREGGDGDSRPASQQETLQERLQREATEFRQQQLQHDQPAGAAPGGRGHHGHRRRSPSGSSRSRSSSSGRSGAPGGRRGRRASRSHSRSRSRSRSSSPGGAARKPAGGRWAHVEDAEQPAGGQPGASPGGAKQPGRSRWALEAGSEDGEAGEVEEGEAPREPGGSGPDDDLEELNRHERAALAAGELGSDGSPPPHGARGLLEAAGVPDPGDAAELAGLAFAKNMLDESRKVDEYERLNRISEGTYGVVYRARDKASGAVHALKKLKLDACPDGFPQTSVREMNVLLSLHHPNIVNVTEVVVGGRDSIFMVMEYVEHDLKYISELQAAKKAPPFSIGQIKCLMQQLLEGVAFLHHHWVLHRDLKTSNLLYSNSGVLKICDFGLARQYGSPLRPFTPAVVTLWYRSIERLLGQPLYSTALDMWSVGCIMAELITGEPLFQGRGELDQIKKIFALLGTPTQESWPGWDELPDARNLQWKPQEPGLRRKFPTSFVGGAPPLLNESGFDLLSRLLEMNPARRISARDALRHRWFDEAPRPVVPALMPSFTPRHQQGADGGGAAAALRDKLAKPSPGAVAPASFAAAK